MTPEEIVSKFSVALDNFEPITDQPSDSDLTRLREAIAPLLLQIPYDETGRVHNLIGIVRADPAYLKRYGEAFPEPTRVGAYDIEIDDDARPSSGHALRRHTRRGALTTPRTTLRERRRHSLCSPSSRKHGSASSETPRLSTLK